MLIVAILFWNSVSGVLKTTIENNGFEIIQTKIEVGGVDVSVTKGQVTIEQIRVTNPKNFQQPNAFTFDNIYITFDKSRLLTNTIVIDEVIIKNPSTWYEINSEGHSNILQIKENIQKYIRTHSEIPNKKGQKKLIIKKLKLNKSKIDVHIDRINKELNIVFPQTVIENINQEKGETYQLIAAQLMLSLTEKVVIETAKSDINQYLNDASERISQKIKIVSDNIENSISKNVNKLVSE